MKYSSGIIKPDGVERNLQDKIFDWFLDSGLVVLFQKTLMLNQGDIAIVYKYCMGTNHYPELEKFMMSGPVIFYVVKSNSDEAVDSLNRLVGSTDPKNSLKETIRGTYGTSVARNVIHSTQNKETFKTEIEHFLTKREILDMFI